VARKHRKSLVRRCGKLTISRKQIGKKLKAKKNQGGNLKFQGEALSEKRVSVERKKGTEKIPTGRTAWGAGGGIKLSKAQESKKVGPGKEERN